MKTIRLIIVLAALVPLAQAADTTPPTLNITHTWMQKVGSVVHFKMLLDPQDETGFGQFPTATAIQFRSKLNSTAALPANTPWNDYPWIRGEPFDIPFNCSSVVFELRARDAAGNVSPLQRRTFASPFPFSPPPNLTPQINSGDQFTGSAQNVRGLFVGRFDGVGTGDDLVQVDRETGAIMVRRQINNQAPKSDVSFSLPADTIEDSASADFDSDSRADLAVIASGALTVYHNDGLDGDGVVQFGAQSVSLSGTGITTFTNIAVGDVTGDGKLDIVVSGTDSGGLSRIGWIIANAMWQYTSSGGAHAPSGTTPGKLALGDINGDGELDVVMVDAAQNQLIVFKNKGGGLIAGDDETDETYQPVLIPTGLGQAGPNPTYPLIAAPVRALTVGDVTGDGRDDILTVFSELLFSNPFDSNDGRTQQRWRLYENRGTSGFRPFTDLPLGQSSTQQSVREDIPSDVMLMDLNNDRFPELLFTNYYGNTVKIIRFTALLDGSNFLTTLDDGSGNPELDEQDYAPKINTGDPSLLGPGRLAKGRLKSSSDINSLAITFAGSNHARWELNATRTSSKPNDIQGGATTDSDATGFAGANGVLSFTEYPGGGITYSLAYINNTTTPLTGVTLESALPDDFLLQYHDEGGVVSGTGASRVIRWTLDVSADSAGVKNFRVKLATTAKAGSSIAPKINLKQGTKILAASALPVVKVGVVNFYAIPNSPGESWEFTFKPSFVPSGSLGAVQASEDGINWQPLPGGSMSASVAAMPVFTLSTTDIPSGSRYFRAAMSSSTEGFKYSSVFSIFLPPTTGLKITTKSPPRTGQTWTFAANQISIAANVQVRFQSTLTPSDEGTWNDLPAYSETVRKTNTWTFSTYNIPSGDRYFRAVSSSPGWVDSISAQAGPYNVQQSSPQLPYFTYFHIDFKDPIRHGDAAAFMATCPAVLGLKVRFQSRPAGGDENSWTDLTDGQTTLSGTKWTFMSKYLPVGQRDWRAIASAPGYNDNTQLISAKIVSEAFETFEVLPAPLPQLATIFAPFTLPADGSIHRTGVPFTVGIDLLDFNGVQKVYLETAQPGTAFKEAKGINFTHLGGVSYVSSVQFTGTGDLYLRIVCIDGYTVSETRRSSTVKITVGPGNGGATGPVIYSAAGTSVQPTRTALGSVLIKARIGDDAQVRIAYVHSMTPEGIYHHTVGEMKRGSAANPSDFTCVDDALDAGEYRYRVVAHDYDGNETVGASFGPITLITQAPPPAPIHLDIVASSQHVQPNLPKTNPNYPHMPYAAAGKVTFNYSGLPGGTTYFLAYRTDLDSDLAYTTKSVTKTTGSVTLNAPEWDEEINKTQGPGEYRIIALNSGLELTVGSGDNTFRVSRSWNQPDSFTELDYGLYWFKNVNNGLKGYSSFQRDDYFDPDKPTVIYVHGWQSGEAQKRRRESWKRQDPFKDSTTYDMCQHWKNKGYNVGMFNWNQFADDSLLESQANIYYIPTQAGMPAGHSMRYQTANTFDAWNKEPGSTRRYFYNGGGGDIEDKNVCDLLLAELYRCMGGYEPGPTKEFRMIGHSLGTQLVGRTCDVIREHPDWGIPLPTRISLLELAQIHGLDPTGLNINSLQFGYISRLKSAGIAIDCYQSTDLQSLLGINLSFVGNIHDMCAYNRWRPDFITPINLSLDIFNKSVGIDGVFIKSHNEIVRWYMESFQHSASTFEAWTYRGFNIFAKDQKVGNALSASTSNAAVRTLMNQNYWFEQSKGKETQDMLDDKWERKGSP